MKQVFILLMFQKTEKFFKIRHGKKLTFSERMEFVNLWYFLIITNDIFTIIGSSFKIQLETRVIFFHCVFVNVL